MYMHPFSHEQTVHSGAPLYVREFSPFLPRPHADLYDKALRPLGLRGTQFTVLQALSLTGEVSQGKLGQILWQLTAPR